MRAKHAILIALMAVMATASARAQPAPGRIVDGQPPETQPAAPKPSSPFIVNENVFGYYYLPNATNPGAGETPKHVALFSHFDVWAYGTNYIQLEFLKATNEKNPTLGTPKLPCDQGPPAYPAGLEQCSGYSEWYGLWRGTLGWNQLLNTKAFAVGPLTNIEFAFGADMNWDDTSLQSRKRSIQAGLQFDFAAPYKGFLNVGVYGYKEWQNDGFAVIFAPFHATPNPSGDVTFNSTWAVEINYSQPLGDSPFKYKALVSIHGPKGCGEPCQPLGPGLVRTTEYLTQQVLVFDWGKAFWNQPDRFAVFAGYRWWKNKFGIDPNQPTGHWTATTEATWLFGAAVKF